MIKRIPQEDETGCLLACVAMLTNRTYEHVKQRANELDINVTDIQNYSDIGPAIRLLETFKVNTADEFTTFREWSSLPSLALLAINPKKEATIEYWHWVVFQSHDGNMRVIDPAPYIDSSFRMDFENIEVRHVLEINPTHAK